MKQGRKANGYQTTIDFNTVYKEIKLKNASVFLCGLFLLLAAMGSANAALTKIGTAQFGGSGPEYNLIYDADSPFGPITWLDFSNSPSAWGAQMSWAAGLNIAGALTYNINSNYKTDWEKSAWRLPSTVDGYNHPWEEGFDGTTTGGYNITTSEMGHLFYTELGNLGYYDINGSIQIGSGLIKIGNPPDNFNNLLSSWYWSGTEYEFSTDWAWLFDMNNGHQTSGYPNGYARKNDYMGYGLAVRSGQVSTVPVPGAFWLLGSGLIGLAGIRRREK